MFNYNYFTYIVLLEFIMIFIHFDDFVLIIGPDMK